MSAPTQNARSPAPVMTTDADVGVGFELGPDLVEPGLGRAVDGVEHVLAVDGHRGDVVLDGQA